MVTFKRSEIKAESGLQSGLDLVALRIFELFLQEFDHIQIGTGKYAPSSLDLIHWDHNCRDRYKSGVSNCPLITLGDSEIQKGWVWGLLFQDWMFPCDKPSPHTACDIETLL